MVIKERIVYGLMAALAGYILLFMYLLLETHTTYEPIRPFFEGARIEDPADIQLKAENIEMPGDFSSSDVKSIARDRNDDRERSSENWSSNKMSAADVERSVKDYERKLFEEAGGEEKRKKLQQEMDDRKKQQTTGPTNPNEKQSTANGGNKAYSGDVMVEWSLSNRPPHQNNTWYVRNPGYTCGYGASGKVTVSIKVNQNGDVTNATYEPTLSRNANYCMIEQAVKYAKMSRFTYSGAAPKLQDGTITYTFVAQ